MALFLAFATLFPDYEIRLFFVIPVKVKWLALLDGAWLIFTIATETGFRRMIPIVAVGNYLLFFAPTLVDLVRGRAGLARRAKAFDAFKRVTDDARAKQRACTLCGVTDADRSVEFRVCTCEKCGKPTEFCLAHSRAH